VTAATTGTTAVTTGEPQAGTGTAPGPRARLRELAVAGVVAGVAVVVLVAAAGITSSVDGGALGPRWWPSVLGALLLAGAVAVAATGLLRPRPAEGEPTLGGLLRLALVLALVAGFGLAWYRLHFLLVMPFLLAGLVAVGGGRGLRDLLLVPALATAVLYGVFGLLLRVPL